MRFPEKHAHLGMQDLPGDGSELAWIKARGPRRRSWRNFFEVGFVRGNVDHPGEHLGVEDPRSALPASSVFMEPNMPNFGWADW